MSDYIIKADSIIKKYNGNTVIDNLNIEIKPGKKLTLFAPSGAGKTTLINILNGLDVKFEGKLYINNHNSSTIFQEPRLFPFMTVKENIFYPLNLKKIKITDKILDDYEEWLEVSGLKNHENYYPFQISGGMKQKVSLIRGFIYSPNLILMDEPFKSIDIKSKVKIMKFIREKYKDISILFVTHNIDEIPLLSDTILIFSKNLGGEHKKISLDSKLDMNMLYKEIMDYFP
jgi:NitT/TauT family transport system ATP-binding protein